MTRQQPKQEATAKPEDARKDALRKAYASATKRLREQYRDQFNSLYAEEAKKLGEEWSPRPTDEQQAEALFDDLLSKYPALRDRVGQEGATE